MWPQTHQRWAWYSFWNFLRFQGRQSSRYWFELFRGWPTFGSLGRSWYFRGRLRFSGRNNWYGCRKNGFWFRQRLRTWLWPILWQCWNWPFSCRIDGCQANNRSTPRRDYCYSKLHGCLWFFSSSISSRRCQCRMANDSLWFPCHSW